MGEDLSATGRMHGLALAIARLAWLAVAAFAISLVVAGIPARYAQLLTVTPAAETLLGQLLPKDAQALSRLGLSVAFYAYYFTILETVLALAFVAVAFLLFWGRSEELPILIFSSGFLFLSNALPIVPALVVVAPALGPFVLLERAGVVGLLIISFFLFPDGRFVPAWTRQLTVVWLLYTVAYIAFPVLRAPMGFGRMMTLAEIPTLLWSLIWLGVGVYAQVYRYRRVASATQRQQTKWVIYGAAVAVAGNGLGLAVLTVPPFLQAGQQEMIFRIVGASSVLLGALAIPLSFGVAILRFRLWDIDLVIRRTLIYGALTATLAVVYFGSVVLLQGLLRVLTGQGQSPVATVVSTLAIAALFTPLRRRMQNVIDRRFYRRKYDAAKTLAAFSATVRDEVDLKSLSERLVAVVEETMQPAHVSLWLREPHNPVAR